MIKFTLYTSNYVGELQNCKYPNMQIITDKATLAQAVSFDHVSAAFKNNYRSAANFISADNVVLDCDNDHSDIPEDWVTPKDVSFLV